MSLIQSYLHEQPADRVIRKATQKFIGVNVSPTEVTNALANSAVRYGPIISLKEAAAIARIAPGTLKRWVSEGRFPRSAKRGKPLLFWRDRFIAEVMR